MSAAFLRSTSLAAAKGKCHLVVPSVQQHAVRAMAGQAESRTSAVSTNTSSSTQWNLFFGVVNIALNVGALLVTTSWSASFGEASWIFLCDRIL